jgi:putative component of membrane protein insertase Oxa1/YidC/SpoIIIJ protein YidD
MQRSKKRLRCMLASLLAKQSGEASKGVARYKSMAVKQARQACSSAGLCSSYRATPVAYLGVYLGVYLVFRRSLNIRLNTKY